VSEKPEELTYERALELLDLKLKELEDGDLPLDRALKAVDEARAYLKVCQDRLDQARQKIEVRADAPAEPELEAR
jgi:exodeoxyribonuclease VII small subunit